jgi:hypothetical protein
MYISYLDPNVKHAKGCARNWKVAVTSDVARLARGISSCVWSPIIWQDGYRKESNFLRARWVALDFDDSLSLQEAMDIWQDSIHIIGTTKSHGIKGERFRVVLRLSEDCEDVADYRHTVETLSRTYGGDSACKDGARFFFPCREIVSTLDEGYTQEIVKAPPPEEYPKREPGTRVIPTRTLRGLRFDKVEVGHRNTWCYGTARDLAWAGFSIDETVRYILASPTYNNSSPPVREILQAVRNGFKSAQVEMQSGEEKRTK